MEKQKRIRKAILEAIHRSGEGHLGSCFSIVEMLIGYGMAMKSDPLRFKLGDFVLSKGHASYAYYAWLHDEGLMEDELFAAVGQTGSKLYGHLPYIENDPRFQFGSGSLGHGLPYAVGRAVSNQLRDNKVRVCCLLGDGEANEGTLWESLLLLNKFSNAELSILIDVNMSSERAIPIAEPLQKLSVCFPDISLVTVDGHDHSAICDAIMNGQGQAVILCKTQKGFPCPTLLGNPIWHHRMPSEDEMSLLLEELLNA